MRKEKPKVDADAFTLIESLNNLRKCANSDSADSEMQTERLKLELILARNKLKAMFKVVVFSCDLLHFAANLTTDTSAEYQLATLARVAGCCDTYLYQLLPTALVIDTVTKAKVAHDQR